MFFIHPGPWPHSPFRKRPRPLDSTGKPNRHFGQANHRTAKGQAQERKKLKGAVVPSILGNRVTPSRPHTTEAPGRRTLTTPLPPRSPPSRLALCLPCAVRGSPTTSGTRIPQAAPTSPSPPDTQAPLARHSPHHRLPQPGPAPPPAVGLPALPLPSPPPDARPHCARKPRPFPARPPGKCGSWPRPLAACPAPFPPGGRRVAPLLPSPSGRCVCGGGAGSVPKMASIMEGPLSKWTNVMKGWQYRWFVLDYNAGLLSYYTVRGSGGPGG